MAINISKVISITHKLKYSIIIKSLKLIYNTCFTPHLIILILYGIYIYIYIYIHNIN